MQYLQENKIEEAIVFINEAYRINSQLPSTQFLLGEAQRKLNSPVFLDMEGPLIPSTTQKIESSFNNAGDRVAIWDTNRKLFGLWNTNTGECVSDDYKGVFLSFSPDGKYYLIKSDNCIKIFDSINANNIGSFLGENYVFSNKENEILILVNDIIRTYNINSCQLLREVKIREQDARLVQVSDDGLWAVTITDPNVSHADQWLSERKSYDKNAKLVIHRHGDGDDVLLVNPYDSNTSYIELLQRELDPFVTKLVIFNVNGSSATITDPNILNTDLLLSEVNLFDRVAKLVLFKNDVISETVTIMNDLSDNFKANNYGAIHIWNLITGECVHSVGPKEGKFTRAILSPNNNRLLTLRNYTDRVQAELWFLDENYKTILLDDNATSTVLPFKDYNVCLSFDQNSKYVLSRLEYSSTIKLWDAKTGSLLWEIPGYFAKFTPSGEFIITCERNSSYIRESISKNIVNDFLDCDNLTSINYNNTNKDSLRVCAKDWFGKGYYIEINHRYKQDFKEITSYNFSYCNNFSLQGDKLLAVTPNSNAKIMNTDPKKCYKTDFGMKVISISPDRKYVALLKNGRSIVFADTITGNFLSEWKPYDNGREIRYGYFYFIPDIPDSKRLIYLKFKWDRSGDEIGKIYNFETKNEIGIKNKNSDKFPNSFLDPSRDLLHNTAHVSPNGKLFALLNYDGDNQVRPKSNLQILETDNGETKVEIKDFDSFITALAFSFDSNYLITITYRRTMQMWDTKTGNIIKTITLKNYADNVIFSPDGKRFLIKTLQSSISNQPGIFELSSPFAYAEIQLWDPEHWNSICTFPMSEHAIFSPDSKRVLCMYDMASDNERRPPLSAIYDANDGSLVTKLVNQNYWMIDPESNTLITEHDSNYSVWNLENGSQVSNMTANTRNMTLDNKILIRSDNTINILIGNCLYSNIFYRDNYEVDYYNYFPIDWKNYYYYWTLAHVPVINSCESHMITESGLVNISPETKSSEEIDKWVKAYIYLRISGDSYRAATPEEICNAKYEYNIHFYGKDNQITIYSDLLMQITQIEGLITSGDLQSALDRLKKLLMCYNQKFGKYETRIGSLIMRLKDAYYANVEFNFGHDNYAQTIPDYRALIDMKEFLISHHNHFANSIFLEHYLDILRPQQELAISYAKLGDYDNAVRYINIALESANNITTWPNENVKNSNLEVIQNQMKCYKAKEPYTSEYRQPFNRNKRF